LRERGRERERERERDSGDSEIDANADVVLIEVLLVNFFDNIIGWLFVFCFFFTTRGSVLK